MNMSPPLSPINYQKNKKASTGGDTNMELSYTQNKLQFNRPSFKDELKDKLGTVCCNCGSNLDVEYHHIIL